MKQFPSSTKYRKNHKYADSFYNINKQRACYPLKGMYYLFCKTAGFLTFRQIEACRRALRRKTKGVGRQLLRLFTFVSKTKKGMGLRMGKGKGAHSLWVCPVRKGQVLCEVSGLSDEQSRLVLKTAKRRLPIKTVIGKVIY